MSKYETRLIHKESSIEFIIVNTEDNDYGAYGFIKFDACFNISFYKNCLHGCELDDWVQLKESLDQVFSKAKYCFSKGHPTLWDVEA